MARVLIVDDDYMVRELLEAFVVSRGHEAFSAVDGPEAIRLVKEIRPHAILLDHMMPGMSGLETLQQIRAVDAETAVVMVTAVGQEELGQRALGYGAYDFVTKPVDLAYLERILYHAISRLLF